MKKTKILSVLLVCTLLIGLLGGAGLSLTAKALDIPDAGVPEKNQLQTKKTATVDDDGNVTITLEAYATGSKIISSTNKDVPTDIVLVIDQSGSMDYCIGCGKEIKNNTGGPSGPGSSSQQQTHTIYTKVTTVDTSKTYYIKSQFGNNQYTKVTYCSGKHNGIGGSTSCSGGAGWYTSEWSSQHTDSDKYTPKTAENPDGTQFYEQKTENCTSRLSSLKTAVTTFVNSVNKKAKGDDGVYGTADDVNHRIAVVGYASDGVKYNKNQYENTELFIGSNYYNYGNSGQSSDSNFLDAGTLASAHYKEAFQNMNTEAGYNNVIASKNALDGYGGTRTQYGIKMANGIFKENPINSDEKRNRVVVVFTDGYPGSGTSVDSTEANAAVKEGHTTKNTYKATVYTVGIFDGADGTPITNLSGVTDPNRFMHLLSSNYNNAQSYSDSTNYGSSTYPSSGSYYLSAGDSDSLNNIFQQIADQIESSSASTTLDENAVIKDIVAPQFQLPEGATADSITLETYTCTGVGSDNEYTWSKNATAMGATATITGDTVDVTGFNFSENWVGTNTQNGATTYRGSKLVIKFTVKAKDGFLGGNDVYTNTSAGVYVNKDATDPVLTFNRPQVNVPIKDVTVTAEDKNVYLLGELTTEQIKSGATAKCGNVTIDLTQPDKNYGLESWQTDYVNINVTYTDAEGNTVTGLNNLQADTTYTVSVTVSPKADGSSTDQGTVAKEKSGTATGKINVFKPTLTFKDSQVWYGDTAPTDYTANKNGEVWKHGDTVSTAVTMIGNAPTLDLTYTPETGKIVDNKIATKNDFAVDVTVKIGTTDVTDKTTFVHTKCDGNCTDPTNGKFWIHVNTCQLTITKAADANTTIGSDEYFVFTIQKDGQPYTQVTIQGTDSVTISELPVGTYTVTEDESVAWRYESSIENSSVTLSKDKTSATIICTNTLEDDHWLNHFNRVINTYGKSEGEKD